MQFLIFKNFFFYLIQFFTLDPCLNLPEFTDYFLCKMQLNTRNRVSLRACHVAMTTKMSVRVDRLIDGLFKITSQPEG